MTKTLLIEPRDPLIFRDPRPAGAGLPIRSVDWPLPSSVIGAIRTRLGRLTNFDKETVSRLKQVTHCGPFLATRRGDESWELAFPAPADALLFATASQIEACALRPRKLAGGAGCDLPAGLFPLFGAHSEKPLRGPGFWMARAAVNWLRRGGVDVKRSDDLGPPPFPRDARVHVQIDSDTLTASQGMLFTTEGLEFSWRDSVWGGYTAAICSRIQTPNGGWPHFESVAPLGAERRLAFWSDADLALPKAPQELGKLRLIRLQLVTPGAFGGGWKPGWLNGENVGQAPGAPGIDLRLVAAAVPRALPHSGFDLTKPPKTAQKAARFLAPAGSVYFFEAMSEVSAEHYWLKSISDLEEDRNDGFGITLCGGWEWL